MCVCNGKFKLDLVASLRFHVLVRGLCNAILVFFVETQFTCQPSSVKDLMCAKIKRKKNNLPSAHRLNFDSIIFQSNEIKKRIILN